MIKAGFFGSSTVEGVGASSPTRRFTSIVARTLGWEEVNLGLAGTTVTGRDDEGQVIDEASALARVPEVLEAAPDVVIILYGACDFRKSRPLGTPDRFRQGTFYSDYDTVLRGLLYALEPTKVAVSTEYFRAYGQIPNDLDLTLESYNEAIRDLATRHGIRLLDSYRESGLTPENWPNHTVDGTQLDDSGHECLAGFFIQALHDKF